ncbi:hypothetical protein A3L11_05810 [Thermococcus siculi]|uniref:Uncharacterized protein n=1 Tax=Thermococcus siculi TaxID=72803 RepID=A0A2Z2MMB4_9EURY|nr:hypothetical protein [Thermococcus siculi]ASJ08765.1 hypothetical protein A3L11_05810 [Thermococcus siculi]
MRRAYLGLLIVLIVFAAGCISGEGSSPTKTTTTSNSLPFTADDLRNAIEGLKSYEYTMRVDSYNGTELVAQLVTVGAIDFEKKLKSVSTFSNTSGGSYYRSYYYTTNDGYAMYFDRNGTVSWEASCYGPGKGPDFNSTILDGLWEVMNIEGVKVVEKDGYYLVYANTTSGTASEGQITAYRTQIELKLTKDLIPVTVRKTVHYRKDSSEWMDITTIEVRRPNGATVEPPEGLVEYLKEQGIDLEEFLSGC